MEACEVTMNIIGKLHDLIKQATTDHSHYYVKSVCEEAVAKIESLRKALEHASICDYPDSVRFRCDGCGEVDALLSER